MNGKTVSDSLFYDKSISQRGCYSYNYKLETTEWNIEG